jgi:AcrR family transcriptional regulator
LALLREGGPGSVNVQAVAARSGVAKTSIYRRFDDRGELLRAAIGSMVKPPTEAPVKGTGERLAWGLNQIEAVLGEVLGPGGVAALMDNREPEFTRLVRRLVKPYTTALARLIDEDIAAGRLRGDVDADAVVSLMVGAYVGELARRGRVARGWERPFVDLLLHAVS